MKQTKSSNPTLGGKQNSVATRKEELLKAGFSVEKLRQDNPKTTAPVVKKLTHPTLSRAMGPKRRLPTSMRLSRREMTFFYQENELFPPETVVSEAEEKLINRLKQAIKNAQIKYQEHYLKGSFPRAETGWFSSFRHRLFGQSRALDFSKIEANAFKALVKKLDDFFNAAETRYHHHSFSSYLLDELMVLLEQENKAVKKPKTGEHYDSSHWTESRLALEELFTKENINLCY
ncbi:hypothetical protein A8135_07310 [Legionella jamestowniensis]|uniref:HTH CENPB-type domain-containing protein n=1 Tax=Legionella jamestowniensis TaxID=455 RepID=A0ABX2Y2K4_9GAMM|nr:hypothetical protein [Legionella jamestowniensis]OCH99481.1 hypothetical protein A8135_07310 [Legionella jamestowniensis]